MTQHRGRCVGGPLHNKGAMAAGTKFTIRRKVKDVFNLGDLNIRETVEVIDKPVGTYQWDDRSATWEWRGWGDDPNRQS